MRKSSFAHSAVHHIPLLLLYHLRLDSCNLRSALLLLLTGLALSSHQLVHPGPRAPLQSRPILLGDLWRILSRRPILGHVPLSHFLTKAKKPLLIQLLITLVHGHTLEVLRQVATIGLSCIEKHLLLLLLLRGHLRRASLVMLLLARMSLLLLGHLHLNKLGTHQLCLICLLVLQLLH